MKKRSRLLYSVLTCIVFLTIGFLFRQEYRQDFQDQYHSSSAIYAREGELLRLTLSNDHKYRQWIPLREISEEIKQGFILSEDRYFYSHFGVNPWALVKAGWSTYLSGSRRSGASTITMQLARMIYHIDSKGLSGKFLQIAYALKLEYLYSKDEILEAYLNLVPMGGNVEGVGAASLIFFQKKPSEIRWPEALLLSVIPQNPNKRTLLNKYTPELKKARQRLYRKVQHLVPEKDKRLVDLDVIPAGLNQLPFSAPHFVYKVLERSSGAAEIKSTLDLTLQTLLEKRLKNYLEVQKKHGIKNAAVLLMNWTTSEVLAWIGSADFFNSEIQGQVDGVTSFRSPGSTLKPFIYGLALDEGLLHPGTILKDSPRAFGSYDPENFDGDFKGPITAEEALNQSRNLPAVELVTKLKDPDFYQFLVEAGVGIPKNREHYGHSIALGGFELNLLELVELYSILPNRGSLIKAALDQNEIGKGQKARRLLSPEASFMILDMLSRAELQSRRFRSLQRMTNFPVSWKTGTSSGFRDGWTMGVFGSYVMGVWVGNFSGESNKNFIGRSLVAPLFFDLIDSVRVQKGIDDQSFFAWTPTPGVRKVEICAVSGKLPGHHCKHLSKISFIPGTSPIDKCDVHRQIWISKKDGSLSCKPNPETDRLIVHEFWPTDLLEIFAQAGLPRRLPPSPAGSCSPDTYAMSGMSPEIISPLEDTVYNLRSKDKSSRRIPLQANLDSSAREIFWFINNEFIGKAAPGAIHLWQARAGQFVLKAIDNLGRSSSRVLKVQYVD